MPFFAQHVCAPVLVVRVTRGVFMGVCLLGYSAPAPLGTDRHDDRAMQRPNCCLPGPKHNTQSSHGLTCTRLPAQSHSQ